MRLSRNWLVVLLVCAAVGAALYALGVPPVVVYVVRGVIRHAAYSNGGH